MTVRNRVAQLERAMPAGEKEIVVLFPDDDSERCIDESCQEHGVSRDAHQFICVRFVEPPARAEE